MIVTLAHYKGGTGKTTSCLSIAGCLAKEGNKVLVIDLDPQGNATSGLGIDKNFYRKNMYQVMNEGLLLTKIIVATDHKNLHLAHSNHTLMKSDLKIYTSTHDTNILKKAVDKISKYYHYILIDTPPSNAHFLLNGIAAADKTILVMDPGIFALEGIESLNSFFKEANKRYGLNSKIDIVLLNKYKKRFIPFKRNFSKEIAEEAKNLIGKKVHLIPYSDLIYHTHQKGIPISHYKPNSRIGKAYKKVSQLISEKIPKIKENP